MSTEKSWRCFHCDEVFSDASTAAKHFGVAIDHRPGCVEKLAAPEKNLVLALRKVCDEFRRLQFQVSEEITNDGYFYGRLRSSLQSIQKFKDCVSLHDVFMLFDSLEGQLLAAREQRDELLVIARREADACGDCDFGNGPTGFETDQRPCQGCGPIRAAIVKAEGLS